MLCEVCAVPTHPWCGGVQDTRCPHCRAFGAAPPRVAQTTRAMVVNDSSEDDASILEAVRGFVKGPTVDGADTPQQVTPSSQPLPECMTPGAERTTGVTRSRSRSPAGSPRATLDEDAEYDAAVLRACAEVEQSLGIRETYAHNEAADSPQPRGAQGTSAEA